MGLDEGFTGLFSVEYDTFIARFLRLGTGATDLLAAHLLFSVPAGLWMGFLFELGRSPK